MRGGDVDRQRFAAGIPEPMTEEEAVSVGVVCGLAVLMAGTGSLAEVARSAGHDLEDAMVAAFGAERWARLMDAAAEIAARPGPWEVGGPTPN